MTVEDSLPDRRLPVLYLGFAHLSLLGAMVAVTVDPAGVAGFFYHPRMVGTVHLVTLGWISASILGSLYMLGPMALRAPLPRRAGDLWAFAAYAVGTLGMVFHFWLDEPRGMVWAAVLVLAALAWVGGRFLHALGRSTLAAESKIHFYFAFLNLYLAGGLGLLAGIDKFHDVLPGYVLASVYAHAHLAALGWATMMVMGAGLRLLPMLLPAALPRGKAVWASAILLEIGVLSLAASWFVGPGWARPALVCSLAGIGVFLSRVVWMLRNRKRSPRKMRRPDWGTLQSLTALVCLLVAATLGTALVVGPEGAWRLPAILAYGVFGVVGFLAQIVVGVGARLVPLYAWLSGVPGRPPGEPTVSPFALAARPGLAAIWILWLLGVPGLAAGFALDLHLLIRWSAALLALATVLNAREGSQALRLLRGSVL